MKFRTLLLSVLVVLAGCQQEPVDQQTDVSEKLETPGKSEDTTAANTKAATENLTEYSDSYSQAYARANELARKSGFNEKDSHDYGLYYASSFMEAREEGESEKKADAKASLYTIQRLTGFSHVYAKVYVNTYLKLRVKGIDDAPANTAAEEAARQAESKMGGSK